MASIECCEKEVAQKVNELNMQNLSKGGADPGNPWWGTLPENASVDAFAEQWKRTIGQNPQMEQTLVEYIAILQNAQVDQSGEGHELPELYPIHV